MDNEERKRLLQTKFPVIEIFDSIQGEGMHMGRLVTFVRFAGCNLRCPWCDTKQSWGEEQTTMMTVEQILFLLRQDRVVLTGGEPLMQEGINDFIELLHDYFFWVAVETNGTYPTGKGRAKPDWVAVSPKPEHYYLHPSCVADEFKFVVTEDFNFTLNALPVLDRYTVGKHFSVPVWLQPDGYALPGSAQKALDIVIENRSGCPDLRVGIQMHKAYSVR